MGSHQGGVREAMMKNEVGGEPSPLSYPPDDNSNWFERTAFTQSQIVQAFIELSETQIRDFPEFAKKTTTTEGFLEDFGYPEGTSEQVLLGVWNSTIPHKLLIESILPNTIRHSVFLTLWSRFISVVDDACYFMEDFTNAKMTFNTYKGRGETARRRQAKQSSPPESDLEKAIGYLSYIAVPMEIERVIFWDRMKTFGQLRSCLIHHGGTFLDSEVKRYSELGNLVCNPSSRSIELNDYFNKMAWSEMWAILHWIGHKLKEYRP
jgi:hypothetical protein